MNFNTYFVDLHIHIGRDWNGRPVKITGSKSLTLTNIVKEASRRKGLDVVGVIDSQSPAVQDEINHLIKSGHAEEIKDGGVRFEDTVLILGSEIEVYDASCSGPIHVLCYFPFLENMNDFSVWLSSKMKNINLSSQRYYGTARELQSYVHNHGGIFIPAHMFTPFKSLYGKGVKRSFHEVLDPQLIDAVELGLSSDTAMANQIKELSNYTYVTNSDAHSLGKMGREYQQVRMKGASFKELKKVLHEKEGREIVANYGMNPRMGKYHETVCAKCLYSTDEVACPACGSKKIVKGVYDRILELRSEVIQDRKRPPYHVQVPLYSLPGIGNKTYERLLGSFESEMTIIHHATKEQLEEVIPAKTANYIINMREGKLDIASGGGGVYGKVEMKSD